MNKEKVIPFLAMAVLFIGICSTLYVHAMQSSYTVIGERLMINGMQYALSDLFGIFPPRLIQTDIGEKTGLPLDELIIFSGVASPSSHMYSIEASDGYQQTVSWANIQKGIITEDYRVYFPELAHSFWVRNVIEIEVK